MGGFRCYEYAGEYPEEEEKPTESHDIFLNLCENTSAHGIPHVTKARGYGKKVFWSLLSLMFLAAMIVNIRTVFILYLSYPVNVILSLESEDNLKFPAITLCNMSPVRQSRYNQYMNVTSSNGTSNMNVTKEMPNPAGSDFTTDLPTTPYEGLSTQSNPSTTGSNYSLANSIKSRNRRSVRTELVCRNGWMEGYGRCFMAGEDGPLPWADAAARCLVEYGQLVTIETPEVQEIVEGMLFGEMYWSGLKQNAGGWGWGNNYGAPTWTNWKPPEPDGSGPCVRASFTYDYQWMDKECSFSDFKTACSIDMPGSCPADWIDSGVRCYFASDVKGSGTDSAAFCEDAYPGATLAIIDSQTEHDFASANVFDGVTSYWIGVKKSDPEAVWPDGSPVDFENWASGQPGTSEGCMAIRPDGTWVITDCDNDIRYICESPLVNITVEEPEHVEPPTCSCSCCESTFTLIPPPDNETVVVSTMEEEPKAVEGSIFNRPALNEDFVSQENLIETLAALPEQDRISLGYLVEEMVLDCQFEGSPCTYSDFAYLHNPVHGNCLMFSSGWNRTEVKTSRKTGKRFGLHLTLNIDQDDYSPDSGDDAGIRLVVHNKDRMPFPEDEGITVAPGGVTYIGLRQSNISRKGGKYGDCIEPSADNHLINAYEEKYPVRYTTSACQKTCFQKLVVNHCGCANPYSITDGKLKAFQKEVPICSTKNVTQDDCQFMVKSKMQRAELLCDCPNSCEQTIYPMDISDGLWPSDIKRDVILSKLAPKIPNLLDDPDDPNKYQRNLLKIQIFYQEFNFEKIYEKPSYSIGNFASDLGGAFGLWFGFSLLTIFEFFEFFLDMFVYFCCRRERKKKENEQPEPRTNRLMRYNTDLKLEEEPSSSSANLEEPDIFINPYLTERKSPKPNKKDKKKLSNGVQVLPPPYQQFNSKYGNGGTNGNSNGKSGITPPPSYYSSSKTYF